MQHRELHWRKLIPGSLLVVGLVFTALIILVRVGLGNMPGRKFTVYAITDQARGILAGSDIWLAGQRAGVVSNVQFLPISSAALAATSLSAGATRRILIEMQILEEHRNLISRNSTAQVRAGSRFLGNPVLHVSLGIPGQPPIQPGDTIATLQQFDAEQVTAKVEAVMTLLPLVKRDLQSAIASASGLDSLLALVLPVANAGNRRPPFAELAASLTEMMQRLDNGSLGLFMNDQQLAGRMKSIQSNADSLKRLYNIETSQLGQFLRDTALFARMDSIASNFSTSLSIFGSKYSSTGPRADALRREIERLSASLRALSEDARKHPFRYIVF